MKPLPSLAALLLVAACASPTSQQALDAKAALTPLDQFPTKVVQDADETVLMVHPDGVSPRQAAALADAGARWRENSGDTITVRAPRGVDDAASYAMADSVRSALIGEGAPPERIVMQGYDAAGDRAAPVVVSFPRLKVQVPVCGGDWGELTATRDNTVPANFGCAVSANMAAQTAHPADLLTAQAETPADASRRQTVTDKYRRGEATGTPVDSSASGTVSQAIR